MKGGGVGEGAIFRNNCPAICCCNCDKSDDARLCVFRCVPRGEGRGGGGRERRFSFRDGGGGSAKVVEGKMVVDMNA